MQFLRADQLQTCRVENYRQTVAATRRAQDATIVRVLIVLRRDLEGLQGRVVANFAQPPKINALETADTLGDRSVSSAAGFYIPTDDNKPLRVGAYAS